MNDKAGTAMSTDPIEGFKAMQRQGWKYFEPMAAYTTPTAARLVRFARVQKGQRVLDVGCGTGVVAITASIHAGAKVTGADLTPELLAAARDNAEVSGADIDWHEADVEKLPFEDRAFDVVLSQFGH